MGKNASKVAQLGIPQKAHYAISKYDHHIIRVCFF